GKVTPGKKLIVFIRRVSRTVRLEIWRDVGVAELARKPVGAEEHPLCTIRVALGCIENAASRRTFGDAIASGGQAAEANRSPDEEPPAIEPLCRHISVSFAEVVMPGNHRADVVENPGGNHHRDMNQDKQDNRKRGDEMDGACALAATEKVREPMEQGIETR